MLWDVDGGLPLVDKYLYSNDNHVVAGALLAVGIINCGVRNECDPVGPHTPLSYQFFLEPIYCSFRMRNPGNRLHLLFVLLVTRT
jgi:hypothetical protein